MPQRVAVHAVGGGRNRRRAPAPVGLLGACPEVGQLEPDRPELREIARGHRGSDVALEEGHEVAAVCGSAALAYRRFEVGDRARRIAEGAPQMGATRKERRASGRLDVHHVERRAELGHRRGELTGGGEGGDEILEQLGIVRAHVARFAEGRGGLACIAQHVRIEDGGLAQALDLSLRRGTLRGILDVELRELRPCAALAIAGLQPRPQLFVVGCAAEAQLEGALDRSVVPLIGPQARELQGELCCPFALLEPNELLEGLGAILRIAVPQLLHQEGPQLLVLGIAIEGVAKGLLGVGTAAFGHEHRRELAGVAHRARHVAPKPRGVHERRVHASELLGLSGALVQDHQLGHGFFVTGIVVEYVEEARARTTPSGRPDDSSQARAFPPELGPFLGVGLVLAHCWRAAPPALRGWCAEQMSASGFHARGSVGSVSRSSA